MCSQCATEFQQLLLKHPPQTSSRGVASMYLCHLHNLVNSRLGKDEFDCGENLKEIYDCGCGGDDEDDKRDGSEAGRPKGAARKPGGADGAGDETRSTSRSGRTRVTLGEGERDPVTGLELVGG